MVPQLAVCIALLAMSASALAQVRPEPTKTAPTEAEANRVRETLAKVNCRATDIEKEHANLFEVDDAQCDIGKYDIKLDGQFNILSMTRD